MQPAVKFLLAAIASGAIVSAQTSTTCNPLHQSCPADPALAKSVEYDFTKGAPDDFTASTGSHPTFDSTGGKFTIARSGDAPTLTSKWYMMFGHYDIVLQTSKGVGTVSSVVLQSDDLDEIDWEWLGADDSNVQTNYYGKGNTAVYNRGETIPQAGNQDGFHTYSLDWTADAIVWSVDGKEIRKLTPQTADTDQYPQTPMQLKLGTWPGGDPSEPKGTIEWAGGEIDYTKGPYTMTVKSVKAIDYSTGKSYSYGDQTGTWESIKSDGGKVSGEGNPDETASTAAASGTAVTASTDAAKLDNQPVATGSAPPTVTSGIVTATSKSGSPVAPFPTGNATAPNASGSGSPSTLATAATTGSPASSASAGNATGVHTNAAGQFGSSVAGTGLIAMLAAALLM